MDKRRVVVTGGSGFIGRALCERLAKSGYAITILSRGSKVSRESQGDYQTVIWSRTLNEELISVLDGAYAVIHLAGENIATGLWTQEKRRKIIDSRVISGQLLAKAIGVCDRKPGVFVQGSAVGFYGYTDSGILDEASPPGSGFLASVVKDWEASSKDVERNSVRRVVIRTGSVLGQDGGMLKQIETAFKFFAGGYPGEGKNWLSWIHIADEVRAIEFLMESDAAQGVYNLTAPNPVMSFELFHLVGQILHRPVWVRIPGFALKSVMGDMAVELLLGGQRVVPFRLLDLGFRFRFSELEAGLMDLMT